MAEDHLKRSASFRSTRGDDRSFDEDPLIELARIVAEDGGFGRHRPPDLRPARNESERRQPPAANETIASQLEAELLRDWDHAGAAAQPEPEPQPHFPEIVIQNVSPPRRDEPESFEEELDALVPDAETFEAVDAALGPAEADAAAMSLPDYQESYGDSYVAEVPVYADEYADGGEAGPEPEEDDYAEAEADAAALAAERREPRRRSSKGLIAAAGVLGVVVMGGAVAAIVGGVGSDRDSGPPPVIRAEAGPAKVEPDGAGEAPAGDGAGQAVFDRVAGRAPKSDEKLVERSEEPQQVTRVVLPEAGAAARDGLGAGAPGAGERAGGPAADSGPEGLASQDRLSGQISSETPSAQNGPRIDPVGPRRVRTVTVRPDGSIASTPAPVRVAETATQPPAPAEADFDAADAPDPVRVRTVRIDGDGEGPARTLESRTDEPPSQFAAAPRPVAPAARGGDPAGAAAAEAAEPAAPADVELAMLPRARPDQVPAVFLGPAAAPQPEQQRAAAPQPEQQRAAAQPAAARGGQPVDLLAAGPAAPRPQAQQPQPVQRAAPAAAPSAASPFAVQLSAQRSEDQARATFAGLRSRFPSILGGHEPQIQRADLGEQGVYYRVRVGAGSQAEAAQLCERLKAAGGSCFVTR